MRWLSIVLISQWEANTILCLDISKCQFHMSNGTSSPSRISNLAIIKELIKLRWLSIVLISQWTFSIMNARKYNVMSWHVQVSISYGKLQCYSNGTSSPCRLSKLSNLSKN